MGQEISNSHFTEQDFRSFNACLQRETAVLESWFRDHRFADDPSIGGFELEAWLVDAEGNPAPINRNYLELLNDPLVVPELSVFNIEFNTPERRLEGTALSQMHQALGTLWTRCDRRAEELNARLAMVGILPTVRDQDLTLANMSRMVRYRALNEQVLRMRQGKPLQLDIRGMETLCAEHWNVMMEAATTSFQIHLQIKESEAVSFFNAAIIISAPMVAATANSPYLFGKNLWDETRIPLFEQAVAVGGDIAGGDPAYRRVTFGSGYLKESMREIFRENLEHYPPLLPQCMEGPPEALKHVRLHNGTIWRWNRPLIGFDQDGTPHVRIEHRVVPAGPSVIDTIANAALFYGLVHALAKDSVAPEKCLSFAQSRANFYGAARDGLRARVVWLDGKRIALQPLLLETLLPLARRGLKGLDIDKADIDNYLGVIQARVATGRTGAHWQRAFTARHGLCMKALTEAYLKCQQGGLPVHEWELP